mmetsp:Transcript_24848/g.69756  ORF Transcript_24848/g.69756 Transcript_24848/m.69756 type:complete len:297 (+) Transcript_24848:37-927(+)
MRRGQLQQQHQPTPAAIITEQSRQPAEHSRRSCQRQPQPPTVTNTDTFATMASSSPSPIIQYDQLSKQEQGDLIRDILPQCQPQEGSPPPTFTNSQLAELKSALPGFQVKKGDAALVENDGISSQSASTSTSTKEEKSVSSHSGAASIISGEGAAEQKSSKHNVGITDVAFFQPQDGSGGDLVGAEPVQAETHSANPNDDSLEWHGAPRFHKEAHLARAFREQVRSGEFRGPTNGICPGFMQCNLVVLPEGKHAFDFLLFCQRNPKACPLVEVCDVGSPHPRGLALGSDLRTDVPK